MKGTQDIDVWNQFYLLIDMKITNREERIAYRQVLEKLLATQRAKDKAAVLAVLPEKQPLARLIDGEYVGLEQLGEINNDQAHWRSGANEALDQTKQAIEQVYKDD